MAQAGQTTTASTANDGVYKMLTLVKLKKFKPLVSSLMFLIFSKPRVFRYSKLCHAFQKMRELILWMHDDMATHKNNRKN